ncbi:lysophospholipid acyltransferase family protein [Shewanella sp. GXUN23E]|uniref:lysophospholipid acyltransferase family protein n=1 Tax=Shewanella sp. GXUN23E TaxID=3422498 RepID=UPI003D7D05E7
MFSTFCRWLMKLTGWQFEGQLPPSGKYIVIVGPHTSNWDFIVGVMARGAMAINIHFLGKHQLFIPPWGWLFKALGGSPVDRRKNNNLVDAVAQLFANDPQYKLALAPEGTRSEVKRWKTGFYHIARQANVDIYPVGLDFGRKKVVISQPLHPSGNMVAEMNQLMDFFRTIKGQKPKVIPDFVE